MSEASAIYRTAFKKAEAFSEREQTRLMRKLRFRMVDLDDDIEPESHYWEKKVKHKYLKECTVTVCNYVTVNCKEAETSCNRGEISIFSLPYSEQAVMEVLGWLSDGGE